MGVTSERWKELYNQQKERAERLSQALRRLINEVPEEQLELAREVWGNTNVRIILDRIAEGKAALERK